MGTCVWLRRTSRVDSCWRHRNRVLPHTKHHSSTISTQPMAATPPPPRTRRESTGHCRRLMSDAERERERERADVGEGQEQDAAATH